MDLKYLEKRLSLAGKKAIVTGSSGGIGAAIAKSFARFGAFVTVLGRNEEKIARTVREIEERGGRCDSFRFDVGSAEESEEFFKAYEEKHGAPDIFVANAGMSVFKYLNETENAEMSRLIDTDLKGVIYGLRWAGNQMEKNGGGNIVIVTSVNAYYPLPSQAVYSGIKAALENIARSMASDLGEYGIRVNAFAPGAVNTDLGSPADGIPHPMPIPLGHQALPEEVGDIVPLMCTDAFSYMTGATVLADGGLMLRDSGYSRRLEWRKKAEEHKKQQEENHD